MFFVVQVIIALTLQGTLKTCPWRAFELLNFKNSIYKEKRETSVSWKNKK